MTRKTKLLLSALIVGALAGVASLSIFGVFTATTQNAGNELSTGSVALSDNDSGAALFNITGAKPGDTWTRCIKVTYNGSLPASVHGYAQGLAGALVPYMSVEIKHGTQSSPTFPDCTGFTPDSHGIVYTGAAAPLIADYDHGLPVRATSSDSYTWNAGDSTVVQLKMTLDPSAPDTVQSATTGSMTIVWEAHSS